jgi:Cu2+-exporting ATPase
VLIDRTARPMCCPGCAAVAQAIIDAGLENFYRHRTAPSRRAEALVPAQLRALDLYDREDVQRSFVRRESSELREAALILEGISCAACVWLSERRLGSMPGVLEFRVNFASHRAHLRWDESQTHLSHILRALSEIGYLAHPFDPRRQEALQRRERAAALRRLAVAGLGAMQVMMLAVGLYSGEDQGMERGMREFLRWVSLLIATPVVLYAAYPFFSGAWRNLRARQLGMDVPVALAVALAYLASAWSTFTGGPEVYFDSVTMFIFLLLTGRFLEMGARHKAGQVSEELVRILPTMATRLAASGEETVAVADLMPGDCVRVKPGETVPADGCILEGFSSVDESLLSGESQPLAKGAGDALVGGTVNQESPLLMRVEKVGADTVVSAVARLLDRAQAEKPRIANQADRVAGWFVAGVLLLAMAVGGWWLVHDPDRALWITLSVLVVTCPCALSLATPAVIAAATGELTRCGLLTTRGHALETLARVTHVVFDKTGTLTLGALRLQRIAPAANHDADRCLRLAAVLEQGSEHAIAAAILNSIGQAEDLPSAIGLRNHPGRGVEGRVDGDTLRLGTPAFIAEFVSVPREQCASNDTSIYLANATEFLCAFQFSDQLRPEAAETVAMLKAQGVEVQLLSGDQHGTVAAVAQRLGIDRAVGGLDPAGKVAEIERLQAAGAVVAMVGDGINDAPVLARSQVSVAMGGGTQLAQASADMLLLSNRLAALVTGLEISRKALGIIRQNLGWALGYNALALPLAAAGWVQPWMAAIGMSLSSLLVVVNALRLSNGGQRSAATVRGDVVPIAEVSQRAPT